MFEHLLEAETTISASRNEVFAFFSDASNLMRLTPPSLGFKILTPVPIRMEEGTLIDYTPSQSANALAHAGLRVESAVRIY